MLGDGVRIESARPTGRWCWTKTTRGEWTRNQPAWKTIPKGTWCRCASALTPDHVWKDWKAFQKAKPNTFQKNIVTLLDLERKEDSMPKPLAQESFVTKSLWVERKHLPKVREGDKYFMMEGSISIFQYLCRFWNSPWIRVCVQGP